MSKTIFNESKNRYTLYAKVVAIFGREWTVAFFFVKYLQFDSIPSALPSAMPSAHNFHYHLSLPPPLKEPQSHLRGPQTAGRSSKPAESVSESAGMASDPVMMVITYGAAA